MKDKAKSRSAIFGLMFLLMTGCASAPQPLNTPSGQPDVTFENASVSDVKTMLTTGAMNWGYTAKQVSDYVAVYEKRDDRVLASALLGSQYDSTPVWRLTFNYAPVGNNVRVMANMHAVTNSGSAFERITDFSKNSRDANVIQEFLETQKAFRVAGIDPASQGKIGIIYDKTLKLTAVVPSSPAAAAGLKVGDRIVEIDGEPVAYSPSLAIKITGKPGTSVAIKVSRSGVESLYTVVRGSP